MEIASLNLLVTFAKFLLIKKRAFSAVNIHDKVSGKYRNSYNRSIYLLVFAKNDSKPDMVHPRYFGVINTSLP